MRKSSRSTRQPEFFQPHSSKTLRSVAEERNSDDGDDEDAMSVNSEDSVPEKTTSKPRQQKLNSATNSRSTREKPVKDDKNEHKIGTVVPPSMVADAEISRRKKNTPAAVIQSLLNYEGQKCRLFDALITGKNINTEVRAVVSIFPRNQITAITEVVNFVLMTGGAQKKWIGNKVELEGLEPEELDELLRDMVSSMTEAQQDGLHINPLSALSTKKNVSIRSNFCEIWDEFVDCVVSLSVTEGSSGVGSNSISLESLDAVLNVLMALSSFAVTTIRSAVTEAILCIGQRLLKVIVDCRVKLDLSSRQLKAEAVKGKVGKSSPKYVAIQKQVNQQEEELEEFTKLVTTIFNAVFVHRYKDSNETIRTLCTHRLGDWLLQDPIRMFEDTYLKYIGWMCSDRSAEVRLGAVSAISNLCDVSDHAQQLVGFLDRFVLRLIEIAAGDVDSRISFAGIVCLRKIQRLGMLDGVDTAVLNSVDAIVFDLESSLELRKEALMFMMDHTEGFDFLTSNVENVDTEVNQKSRKNAKKQSSDDTADNLARRRFTILALETLVEFIEEHAQVGLQTANTGSVSGETADNKMYKITSVLYPMAVQLVEAVESISSSHTGLIRDWDSIISLLLRESEVYASAYALSDTHATILLQIMLASSQRCLSNSTSSSSRVDDSVCFADLKDQLNRHLLNLMTRFQDNEEQLFVFASLLECCDVAKNMKTLQSFLKFASDAYLRCRSEPLLQKLANCLKHWKELCAKDTTANQYVDNSIRSILSSLWGIISNAEHDITKYSSVEVKDVHKRKGRVSGESSADKISDEVLAINVALQKFCIICRNLDCRSFIEAESVHDIVGKLSKLTIKAIRMIDLSAESVRRQSIDFKKSLFLSASAAGRSIYNILLWCTRNVFVPSPADIDVSSSKHRGGQTSETNDHNDDNLQIVLFVRNELLTVLQCWMDFGAEEEDVASCIDDSVLEQLWLLQKDAFQIIGDIRVLFAPSTQNEAIKTLFWLPSQDILQSMRRVFDSETSRLQHLLSDCGDSVADRNRSKILSVELAEGFLYPLSQGMIYDIANINRRQAAAILNFLVNPNDRVVEVIKTWTKKLKDADPIKYLEIQMVALKASFTEQVMQYLAKLRDASAPESEQNYSTEDIDILEIALEEGVRNVQFFSQRIAQTMGVGKLKGDTASALVNFFRNGIDFAFSESVAMPFFAVMEVYFRFLPLNLITEVSEFFHERLDSPLISQDVLDLIECDHTSMKLWSTRSYRSFYSFSSILSGKKSTVHHDNDKSFGSRTESIATSNLSRKMKDKVGNILDATANSENDSIGQSTEKNKSSTVVPASDGIRYSQNSAQSWVNTVSKSSQQSLEKKNYASKKRYTDEYSFPAETQTSQESLTRVGVSGHTKNSGRDSDHNQSKLNFLQSDLQSEKASQESDLSYSKRRKLGTSSDSKSSVKSAYEDEIVYGLHIEDVFNTQQSAKTTRRISGRSSGIQSQRSSGSFFAEKVEDAVPDLILAKSSRNRNR